MWQGIIILFLAIVIGYIFSEYIIVRKARKYHSIGRNKKGYHVHHSMYGIAFFLVAPFTIQYVIETLCLIGFGLGIIIEHTKNERFVFIEKESKTRNNN